MINRKFLIFILIPFFLFISSINCLADSIYMNFILYTAINEGFFDDSGVFQENYFNYNSLLKNPVPVFMLPWFFGYEKRFSQNSIFNHIFEFEISQSSIYSMPLDYGKSDTVWLFYLKYGIGLIKISIENIFFIKISMFTGLGYGYHYLTYYPLCEEDEKYYKNTFHYFDFFIEPRISFGFLMMKNTFLFVGYTRKISIFYSEAFNPQDRLHVMIYLEYII